jgi:Starch-binding associating with outer membrane
MKKLINIIPALLLLLAAGSCKKYLDVNKDPNNPADVQESLLLAPIETAISTDLAGGSLTIGNYVTITEVTEFWVQQMALNQLAPQNDTYKVRPDDMDQQFLVIYSTILQNAKIMDAKAEAAGHHSYGVVAKVLIAYTMGIVTDMVGDAPYSKAFNGALSPAYDKQEDIYKNLQSLLDSAIAENALDPGNAAPGPDDFLYGGDMSKWQKFAYALKARMDIHLTKAPGYTAATQAGLALTALQNGFSSQDDEAIFAAYGNTAGTENPWFENIDPSNGPIELASTFLDSLVFRHDPRLHIITTPGSDGDSGRVIGSQPDPDASVYSNVGDFYAASNAPQPLLTYSETLFIKAEATFITSGAAAATPVYIKAINSAMNKLGVDTTSAPVMAYIASRTPLTTANAIQRIMEEKDIANFLSIENFNDWRRTGFPTISIVQSPYVPAIPRRFPYPLAELTSNPQPQQSLKITDRVWWDAP